MKKQAFSIMATVAVAALAVTGCGQGSVSGQEKPSTDSSSGAAGLTTVKVGYLPISSSAALKYGVSKGIFEKHGLELELTMSNTGAAMLPAVTTGDLQIGVGNPLSVMTAVDKGLDMKFVGGYTLSRAEGADVNAVITRKDTGISTFADLAGKTTALNALKTQGELTVKESAALEGADAGALKFSEMAFPDMEAQLDRGNVDAIWVPDPFMSKALANPDNKLVGYPNQSALPGMPTVVTFTSKKYADEHAETVADFQKAMIETLSAADEDNDGAKALLPDFLKMDPKVVEGLKMEPWSGDMPTESLTALGELSAKYGFLSKAPDVPAMTVK